jgi:hypothetical protein
MRPVNPNLFHLLLIIVLPYAIALLLHRCFA